MPGQVFYTGGSGALPDPLLDPERDAAEIAELCGTAAARRVPRAITPIAIPLATTCPIETIVDLDAAYRSMPMAPAAQRVDVDLAGGRVARLRRRRRGQITSALQLFGNVTFWTFWKNGYEALAALDDNGDGELGGPELRHLALWHDANRNGRQRSRRGASLRATAS